MATNQGVQRHPACVRRQPVNAQLLQRSCPKNCSLAACCGERSTCIRLFDENAHDDCDIIMGLVVERVGKFWNVHVTPCQSAPRRQQRACAQTSCGLRPCRMLLENCIPGSCLAALMDPPLREKVVTWAACACGRGTTSVAHPVPSSKTLGTESCFKNALSLWMSCAKLQLPAKERSRTEWPGLAMGRSRVRFRCSTLAPSTCSSLATQCVSPTT